MSVYLIYNIVFSCNLIVTYKSNILNQFFTQLFNSEINTFNLKCWKSKLKLERTKNIKQIMTHLEGNRHIQKMYDRLSKSLKGQADSLLPKGPVIICFIMPLCNRAFEAKISF